jgi:hypothetical protein
MEVFIMQFSAKPYISSLLGLNILHSTLFSITFSPCCINSNPFQQIGYYLEVYMDPSMKTSIFM